MEADLHWEAVCTARIIGGKVMALSPGRTYCVWGRTGREGKATAKVSSGTTM